MSSSSKQLVWELDSCELLHASSEAKEGLEICLGLRC